MRVPAPVRLQTSVWNPLGERRALLLHGLGSDASTWWRLASQLADDGFLVLAPDLRSHGRSPTAIDHSFAALTSDVVMLGEAYDLVVGHELGGALAAVLLERPCFASAAVLIDPLLRLPDAQRDAYREAVHAEVGVADAAALRARQPGWDERDVQRRLLAAALVTPDVVDAVLDHNDPWDLSATPGRWGARVHLLAADPDRGGVLHPALLDTLAGGRGHVTGEIAAGCGSSVHRERPDLVARAVQEVLTGPVA